MAHSKAIHQAHTHVRSEIRAHTLGCYRDFIHTDAHKSLQAKGQGNKCSLLTYACAHTCSLSYLPQTVPTKRTRQLYVGKLNSTSVDFASAHSFAVTSSTRSPPLIFSLTLSTHPRFSSSFSPERLPRASQMSFYEPELYSSFPLLPSLPASLSPLTPHTLQEILGGPHAAEQKYDAEFFKKFRSQNIVLSARNYARVTSDPASLIMPLNLLLLSCLHLHLAQMWYGLSCQFIGYPELMQSTTTVRL